MIELQNFWDTADVRQEKGFQSSYAVLSRSVMSNSVTPRTAPLQAPLSAGVLQARTLQWVLRPCSRGSFRPNAGTETRSPTLQADFFTIWATREALQYGSNLFFPCNMFLDHVNGKNEIKKEMDIFILAKYYNLGSSLPESCENCLAC